MVIALESKSSSLNPAGDCAVHLGDTAVPMLRTALAAVCVTAQHSAAMLKLHSLSNLLGVRGSKTGRFIAESANLISATVAGKL